MEISDYLILIAGAILSIGFEYIPGLHKWYNDLDDTPQRLVMLGVLLASAVAIFALSCAGYLDKLMPGVSVACSEDGALLLIRAFMLLLVANQGTYQILPKREDDSQSDHAGLGIGGAPYDEIPY